MLANLPVLLGMMLIRPVRAEGPEGADAAAHPRLSSGANRGVASQQAAAFARPPEQGYASREERASRSRGPGLSVRRPPGAPGESPAAWQRSSPDAARGGPARF